MQRALAMIFFFSATATTTPALAQTLTVEVELVDTPPGEARPPALRRRAPRAESAPVIIVPRAEPPRVELRAEPPRRYEQPEVAPAPVVIVRPPEPETRDERWSEEPPRSDESRRAPPPPVVVVSPSGETTPARTPQREEEDIEGWAGIGIYTEMLDLGGADLRLNAPEIEALEGYALPGDNDALSQVFTGGAMLHLGMRAFGFLRGPEFRLYLGGGEIDGDPIAAGSGLEITPRSIFVVRAEMALGFQARLGPATFYAQGLASYGTALIQADVRHTALGDLGSETIEAELPGLGVEAGIDFEVEDGSTLGVAVRANLLGPASGSLVLRGSWGGD